MNTLYLVECIVRDGEFESLQSTFLNAPPNDLDQFCTDQFTHEGAGQLTFDHTVTPINHIDDIRAHYSMPDPSLPCHVCGTLVDKDELDENGAYTYPDNKPYCANHYPPRT
jgi:hypothetical protein